MRKKTHATRCRDAVGGAEQEEAGLLEDFLQASHGGEARKRIPGRGSSLSKGMEGRGNQPIHEWLAIR